jgi:hypothetical protein
MLWGIAQLNPSIAEWIQRTSTGDPENPLTSALGGWGLGSEPFLKTAIALAQSDDDQKRQRTSRRLKAVTAK